MPYFSFQQLILSDFECEYSLDLSNMQATYLYSRIQIHIRMGQVPNPNKKIESEMKNENKKYKNQCLS